MVKKIAPGQPEALRASGFSFGGHPSFRNPLFETSLAVDSVGNVYVANNGGHTIRKISPGGVVSIVAGLPGVAGLETGPLPGKLDTPRGLALQGDKTLYVTSAGKPLKIDLPLIKKVSFIMSIHHLCRRAALLAFLALGLVACGGGGASPQAVDAPPTITVQLPGISLTAGSGAGVGNSDGTGRSAYFNYPAGIAFAADGTFFVSDLANRTIRKVSMDGTVTTIAGRAGIAGTQDGTYAEATFSFPGDLALAKDGNLYVLDSVTLRALTPDGRVITVASPRALRGIATAPDGNLYGATSTAVYLLASGSSTLIAGQEGTSGTANGTGSAAQFFDISDLAVDTARNIYVSDPRTHTIRKIDKDNVVTTLAGSVSALGSVDGTGAAARFSTPRTLALDAAGNLWVAEIGSGRFRKVTPAGDVTTPFGATRDFFPISGAPPVPLAIGPSGDLYFGVGKGISRIDAAGALTPVAGHDFVAEAGIGAVAGLATDPAGNVIVASAAPGSVQLSKFTPSGERLPFSASVAVVPFLPFTGVGADAAGNVYVASVVTTGGSINVFIPAGGSISKVAPDGTVSSLFSWPSGSANAMAPGSLTVGRDGALYFIDLITNNLVRWTAEAGFAVLANTGPRENLFSLSQWFIAADASGTVYISRNGRVLKLQNGALVTVLTSDVSQSASIVTDAAGNLYMANREVVLKLTPGGVVSTAVGQRGSSGLHTGPLPGSLGSSVGWMAIGPDGVLHLVSENALVKVRFQ